MFPSVAFDPLTIIEAGYDLSVSDADWVRGLSEVMSRVITGPAGTVGYRYDRRPDLRYAGSSFSVIQGDPALTTLAAEAIGWYPADAAGRFFGSAGMNSLSEQSRFPMLPASVERGLEDFCGLIIGNVESGVAIGAASPRRVVIHAHCRRRWRRVAAHLTAIDRLRRSLVGHAGSRVEAVLTPAGRLVHATRTAQRADARCALRDAVVAMEKARGALRHEDPDRALGLWRELVAGRWTLVEEFESDGRRIIVAHANCPEAAPLRELTQREQTILRLLLRGVSSTSAAAVLGISPGAVSQQVKQLLRKLRVRSVASLVNLRAQLASGARTAMLDLAGVSAWVVSVDHLNAGSAKGLSSAERQIASFILDGLSTAEVAEKRRTSYRTVANQIASLYAKLGVGSRAELALILGVGGVDGLNATAASARQQ